MMAWISQNLHWAWLTAGLVLMILEIFGASGYLLISGLAATTVALATYVNPELAPKWQLLLLGFSAVVMAAAVTFWFRKMDKTSQTIDVGKPGSDLVGKTVRLTAPIKDHESRIRLQDANWDLRCELASLPEGEAVLIQDVQGRTLLVKAVAPK
jgi:hypothetical protein